MTADLGAIGIILPFSPHRRPGTLGGDYLAEAIEALQLSANARGLYPEWAYTGSDGDISPEDLGYARIIAAHTRVALCRRTMLYSAFAAESFVNEFMAMYFDGQDLKTLDRLSTVEKYVVATRMALGKALFNRGGEPIQKLQRLFKLRDLLVHPKPGKGLSVPDPIAGDPDFNPREAAILLVAVATAAEVLLREACVGDRFHVSVSGIVGGGAGIIEFGERATQALPDLQTPPQKVRLVVIQERLPDFDYEPITGPDA
jgi:hypothetical protein